MEDLDGDDESYEDELDSDQDLDSELNDNFDINDVNKADSESSQRKGKNDDGKLCSESDEDDLEQDLDSLRAGEEGEASAKGQPAKVETQASAGSAE